MIEACQDAANLNFFTGVMLGAVICITLDVIQDRYLQRFRKKHGFDPRVDEETLRYIVEKKWEERRAK